MEKHKIVKNYLAVAATKDELLQEPRRILENRGGIIQFKNWEDLKSLFEQAIDLGKNEKLAGIVINDDGIAFYITRS